MDECIIKPEKIYCYGNQYRFELTVYFMTIFSLTLKIIIYREIGEPGRWKDAVDFPNARDLLFLREQINRLSKHLTNTFGGLGIISYIYSGSDVILHINKDILTEDSLISGKFGHSKIEK